MAGASTFKSTALILFLVFSLFASARPVFAQQSTEDGREEAARLIDRLRNGDEESRRAAALALGALPASLPEINAALRQALEDRAQPVRARAAASLAQRGDAEAIPKLAELLARDRSILVKKEAAYALGHLRSPASTAALVAASRHKETEVRAAATIGLTMHADPSTIPALIERLRDKSEFVRAQAARGLGTLGPAARSAVPQMIGLLQRDAAGEVRREAASALGKIGDPAALPALEAAARGDDPYLSAAAREAITAINGGTPDR